MWNKKEGNALVLLAFKGFRCWKSTLRNSSPKSFYKQKTSENPLGVQLSVEAADYPEPLK